jgi:hypothetical protein
MVTLRDVYVDKGIDDTAIGDFIERGIDVAVSGLELVDVCLGLEKSTGHKTAQLTIPLQRHDEEIEPRRDDATHGAKRYRANLCRELRALTSQGSLEL